MKKFKQLKALKWKLALFPTVFLTITISFLVYAKLSLAATATWTNTGGDGLWSTCANWSGGTGTGGCPGSSDIATFNNTSTANIAIDTTASVAGVSIASTYSGIITQNTGVTVTIGSSGFTQAGGTFTGGNSTIDISGVFNLSSGTFTAPSNTTTVTGNFTISGGTFNASGGIVTLTGDGDSLADTYTITSSASTFSNLTINSTDGATDTFQLGANLIVGKNLTITAGTFDVTASNYNITIGGNLTNNGTMNNRSNTVTFNDNTQNSVITGTSGITFYNLTSTTASKILKFGAGKTFRINGLLTITGTANNQVNLVSASPAGKLANWCSNSYCNTSWTGAIRVSSEVIISTTVAFGIIAVIGYLTPSTTISEASAPKLSLILYAKSTPVA